MSDTNTPETQPTTETQNSEPTESFGQLLSEYQKTHAPKREDGRKQLQGTVIAINAESVFLDIGYKTEGILPLADFQGAGQEVKVGDKFPVSIKGRDPEGYYELSRTRVELPRDWSALERAFAEKATIMGTVTGAIKGGLTVDVGVRAFMPASRSGVRDAAEMEKLVGEEIRCRIIKLDVADEDLVVDRRAVLEEEERSQRDRRYAEIAEGNVMQGTVRSLTDYGAFVDIGGVDALLHVADMSWSRIGSPADVLSVGQEVEVKVLKSSEEQGKRRISVGLKQLQPHPWDAVGGKYNTGDKVKGTVSRLMDFGAFVELEPGVEGLIHISEMSWGKRVRKPGDIVKPGDSVEVVILGVNIGEQRISLGLKQALGDPWADATRKYAVGAVVEGPVTSIQKFGAFVQIAEGVEGMVHVSEISADRRINHPQDVLKSGQQVRAQVLAIDAEKRQIKLSMKQLVPTSIDEYIAEHKAGDLVTGRLIDVNGRDARVELGEGIQATCRLKEQQAPKEEMKQEGKADLSSLSSMLQARWKGADASASSKSQPVEAGQIRSFRIIKLNAEAKQIEVELV